MAKKSRCLEASGMTTDGKPVMRNAFPLYAEAGLPLESILDMFNFNNWVVDWADFVAGAKADGWNVRTIQAKVFAACAEVYGKAHAHEVEKRLSLILN